jgi:hypothetical protein
MLLHSNSKSFKAPIDQKTVERRGNGSQTLRENYKFLVKILKNVIKTEKQKIIRYYYKNKFNVIKKTYKLAGI